MWLGGLFKLIILLTKSDGLHFLRTAKPGLGHQQTCKHLCWVMSNPVWGQVTISIYWSHVVVMNNVHVSITKVTTSRWTRSFSSLGDFLVRISFEKVLPSTVRLPGIIWIIGAFSSVVNLVKRSFTINWKSEAFRTVFFSKIILM